MARRPEGNLTFFFQSCQLQLLNIFVKLRILDYIHVRKGPNKVRFFGIFQHLRDAIKLFSMEQYISVDSNYLIY